MNAAPVIPLESAAAPPSPRRADPPVDYVEFATTSNFSFLHGASHPEELVAQADHAGLTGFGLADRNTVAGVVRAHSVRRENKLTFRYHPGARLVFADGTPDILAYPRDRAGWGRLCRLLTRGNGRAEKGHCILRLPDLLDFADGLALVVMERATGEQPPAAARKPTLFDREENAPNILPPQRRSRRGEGTAPPAADIRALLPRLCEASFGHARLAAAMLYRGTDRRRIAERAALARDAAVPLIAVNDVLYHHSDRRALQDVLTCIREHVTIDNAGRLLAMNAERFFKPPREMARLFADAPEAIAETLALSDSLGFSLEQLRYEYPDEARRGFATTQEALVHFTYEGARARYPDGIPSKVEEALAHELALIAQVQYAPYFLTVHDIVRFARSKGILCQGRGSAANSAVCFCLGITEVHPDKHDLLFERFISTSRNEPPDIDVDFEHERREEVIQYIYETYGRERAGIAATVISYRSRSAIREVGKAFGLSEDTISALASTIWGAGGEQNDATHSVHTRKGKRDEPPPDPAPEAEEADRSRKVAVTSHAMRRVGLDPATPRVAKIFGCANEILGFPRHLSQHVGGFVITRGRLDEVVPIANAAMEDRTFVEWDKDDLNDLGILKVDVLGLGMLTCIRKAFGLIERHYPDWHAAEGMPAQPLTLASIPAEDPAVYRMLQRADTVGVFQVESRAQMSMLPRLKPERFYDLVVEVAIVRPGPIQGDMVHPYLRRRQGLEKVSYPSKELEQVLQKTLGVPLFQEQAMRIAIVAAGFTPAEADQLRRAMATFKRVGTISTFQRKMIDGMVAKGYPADFAEHCFRQIEGFGEYGFPESHAASFALLVYASSWLKCRYPDAFAAALLNSQPMGFYAPAQIVRDVREHGVAVRAVDINHSDWDGTLEPASWEERRVHALHADMAGDIRTAAAIRLGLREVRGLREEEGRRIAECRGHPRRAYTSVRDLWVRTGLPASVLERLADADAFGSLGLTRRQALWAVKGLGRSGDKDRLPLFEAQGSLGFDPVGFAEEGGATPGYEYQGEPEVALPAMGLGAEVVNDYRFLKLSLRAHPSSFLRADLHAAGIIPNARLRETRTRTRVRVSGLVTIRQRPGSAQGVVFMTIEDETAIANIIVWPKVFERFRPIVLGARYISVEGPVQHESGVIHVVAEHLEDLTGLLGRLTQDEPEDRPLERTLSNADEVKHPQDTYRDKGTARRKKALAKIIADMPELAADVAVSARGSAHAPNRRSRR